MSKFHAILSHRASAEKTVNGDERRAEADAIDDQLEKRQQQGIISPWNCELQDPHRPRRFSVSTIGSASSLLYSDFDTSVDSFGGSTTTGDDDDDDDDSDATTVETKSTDVTERPEVKTKDEERKDAAAIRWYAGEAESCADLHSLPHPRHHAKQDVTARVSFVPRHTSKEQPERVTRRSRVVTFDLVNNEKAPHYGTKPGHFETSKIHFPTSEGVSEVSERANE